jgi:hypothetical protein
VWRWPPPPWGRIPWRGWGRARRHPPPFRVAVPAYTTCNLFLTRCGFLNSRCSTALLSPLFVRCVRFMDATAGRWGGASGDARRRGGGGEVRWWQRTWVEKARGATINLGAGRWGGGWVGNDVAGLRAKRNQDETCSGYQKHNFLWCAYWSKNLCKILGSM